MGRAFVFKMWCGEITKTKEVNKVKAWSKLTSAQANISTLLTQGGLQITNKNELWKQNNAAPETVFFFFYSDFSDYMNSSLAELYCLIKLLLIFSH